MKIAEFWIRAHSDERNEPSGPRFGGFVLSVFMILLSFLTMYAAFKGHKHAADTGVKLVLGFGTTVAVLYGASQIKSGFVGWHSLSSTPTSAVASQPLQLDALPRLGGMPNPRTSETAANPTESAPRSMEEAIKAATSKTEAKLKKLLSGHAAKRRIERITRIVRAKDLIAKTPPVSEVQRPQKPLSDALQEKLAIAVETEPWKRLDAYIAWALENEWREE